MRRYLQQVLGCMAVVVAAGSAAAFLGASDKLQALAAPAELLAGCQDIPETVALAQTLNDRTLRLETYKQEIDRRKNELSAAQAELTRKLEELRKLKQQTSDHRIANDQRRDDDISGLIAIYDQMKPDQAATILANLPPDFAAQILVRVQPETGARIMGAFPPDQAAIMTPYMGLGRSARN